MSQRAFRRHHRERMIAHARRITRRWHNSYEQSWNGPLSQPDHTKADEVAVRYHNHLKVCSAACHGCGNRRHGGYNHPYTRQELIAELSFLEELRLLGLV